MRKNNEPFLAGTGIGGGVDASFGLFRSVSCFFC